jgi:hypothetical protein
VDEAGQIALTLIVPLGTQVVLRSNIADDATPQSFSRGTVAERSQA